LSPDQSGRERLKKLELGESVLRGKRVGWIRRTVDIVRRPKLALFQIERSGFLGRGVRRGGDAGEDEGEQQT